MADGLYHQLIVMNVAKDDARDAVRAGCRQLGECIAWLKKRGRADGIGSGLRYALNLSSCISPTGPITTPTRAQQTCIHKCSDFSPTATINIHHTDTCWPSANSHNVTGFSATSDRPSARASSSARASFPTPHSVITLNNVLCNNVVHGQGLTVNIYSKREAAASTLHAAGGLPGESCRSTHDRSATDPPSPSARSMRETRSSGRRVSPDGHAAVPSVFVIHKSDMADCERRLLQLADSLCAEGVDVKLDLYEQDDPPENWPKWKEDQCAASDYVLYIPNRRNLPVLGAARAACRTGAFEERLLYGLLTSQEQCRKVIPVLLGHDAELEDVPLSLRHVLHYHVLSFPPQLGERGHEAFTNLYVRLTSQNRCPAPLRGDVRGLLHSPETAPSGRS